MQKKSSFTSTMHEDKVESLTQIFIKASMHQVAEFDFRQMIQKRTTKDMDITAFAIGMGIPYTCIRELIAIHNG